ncbi:MAG TPA: preprotein translocase subunit SecE, partial [Candidatus Paceibacterota bacterium]|nr:preprotein translocase subunit SecE [Candidatus Paceibacterota bacterium]
KSPKLDFCGIFCYIHTIMNSVITFFKGVGSEAKKTTWLSPTEALGHTAIVVVLSVAVGFYLGLFDGIFNKVLQMLIAK